MSETVPVRFEVLGVEAVHGVGRLLGLACVALDVAGVEWTLQGVQVVRGADGGLAVRAPVFRHPRDGRSLPAVVLPDGLRDAITAEVLGSFRAAVAGEGGANNAPPLP